MTKVYKTSWENCSVTSCLICRRFVSCGHKGKILLLFGNSCGFWQCAMQSMVLFKASL